MQALTHEEVVALWEAAASDPAWRTRVLAQPPAVRRLLLAIADARYVEGAEEASRSRAVYATLEADLDPCAPADAARIRRLFDGPLKVAWPMDLVRRAFRRSADRETEVRCGLLHAQSLLLGGDVAGSEGIAQAILHRVAGTAAEGEGAALLLLERASWIAGRHVESLLLASAAVRWADAYGTEWWRVLAWQYRVEALVVLGAVAAAEDALATLAERVEALPEDRRLRARATARAIGGVVLLFAGEPEAAIHALRAARAALKELAPATEADVYFDVEVDALRRLGKMREAAAALSRAEQRATTAEQRLHAGALRAALAATAGRVADVLGFVEGLGDETTSRLSAGLRLTALEDVLDACPDDRRFDVVADRAAPLASEALAVRVGEVARFEAGLPEVSRAATGALTDLGHLARRVDPFGRRDARPWADVRAAVATSRAVRDAVRHEGERPFACARCGRVATWRDGWLPIRSLLPHADSELAMLPTCEACEPHAA